ncbi:MTMR12 [Cordylochernes scorpioides]|uniref:MTMR12 n=1 Tax=Cordylochernes scorpioides TaxID=51811 RepID=A0ABY6JYS0_9ARAC|nr:MTMR12 [Cordylochernes scorpioides]
MIIMVSRSRRLLLLLDDSDLCVVAGRPLTAPLFASPQDWQVELQRCGLTQGWRVSQANENYQLSERLQEFHEFMLLKLFDDKQWPLPKSNPTSECKLPNRTLAHFLPRSMVVPASILDATLFQAAPYFVAHRVPVWTWGLESGASLIRMSLQDPAVTDEDNITRTVIDALSVHNKIHISDLSRDLPSVTEVAESFNKLQDLCMPSHDNHGSTPKFWEQDRHFFVRLEDSHWLTYVSRCLRRALELAQHMAQNTSVVLMEAGSRDLSCVVASLIQLLLDPHSRTQKGFEYLLDKEWLALGHPFTDRLGHLDERLMDLSKGPTPGIRRSCVCTHVRVGSKDFHVRNGLKLQAKSDFHQSVPGSWCHDQRKLHPYTPFHEIMEFNNKEQVSGQSPILLLYLDCVWQLTRQCPASFQFSQTYLTCLWDTAHLSLVDTFLFNCHAARESHFTQPHWDWDLQFTRHNQALFRNPLYILNQFLEPHSLTGVYWDDPEELFDLDPEVRSLELWTQCYLRWIPAAQVIGGGDGVTYLWQRKLAEEVEALCKQITLRKPHRRMPSDDYLFTTELDSSELRPDNIVMTSAFPFSPLGPWDVRHYVAVPASSYLHISLPTEYEDD